MDADETVPLRRSFLPTTSTVVQGSGGLAGWLAEVYTHKAPPKTQASPAAAAAASAY